MPSVKSFQWELKLPKKKLRIHSDFGKDDTIRDDVRDEMQIQNEDGRDVAQPTETVEHSRGDALLILFDNSEFE